MSVVSGLTRWQKRRLAVSMAAVLTTAGCGGGSGGDGDTAALSGGGGDGSDEPTPEPSQPTSETTKISGTAIKGRMMEAVVTAHPVRTGSDGRPEVADNRIIGEPVRTDSEGRFTLSFPGEATEEGEWVVLRLRVDDQTRMLCDVIMGCVDSVSASQTSFGGLVELDADFSMSAAFELGSGASVHLSPLSDMAVAYARGSSQGLTEAGIRHAYRHTDAAFGLARDTVRQTRPADLTALAQDYSTDAVKVAVANASFLRWASARDGISLHDALKQTRHAVQTEGALALNAADEPGTLSRLALFDAGAELTHALGQRFQGTVAESVLAQSEAWAVAGYERTAKEAGVIPDPKPEPDPDPKPDPKPEPGGGIASDAAKLSWDAPPSRVNGNTLKMGQIAGYELRYGQSPENLQHSIEISGAHKTEFLLEDLEQGKWHFTVVTVDTGGRESPESDLVSKRIAEQE